VDFLLSMCICHQTMLFVYVCLSNFTYVCVYGKDISTSLTQMDETVWVRTIK
jgi:hypothetical protein